MATTATTVTDLTPVLISLIPVVVGGLLTLAGGIGGGLLLHWLKSRSEKTTRRAEKYEELLSAIFDHKHWLSQMNSHRVFGAEAPPSNSPVATIRAIASLYFPQFKDKVTALDLASDQYELWMFKAGQERLQNGTPSAACMAEVKTVYEPYLRASHELIKALESHAVDLYR